MFKQEEKRYGDRHYLVDSWIGSVEVGNSQVGVCEESAGECTLPYAIPGKEEGVKQKSSKRKSVFLWLRSGD